MLTRVDGRRAVVAFKAQLTTLSGAVGVMWASLGVNAVLGGALFRYGVVPRTITGLRGIVFAPFIHANVAHLAANTVPFALLGWLVMLSGRRRFLRVTLAAMLGSGLMAWLLGASGSVHIGASGVIFGYLGYLMLTGVFTRNFWSIALSVGVTALWGGLVFGVMPGQAGISWQAHFGGFVAGVLAARALRGR
ncbi:MAG TPA: rhomboid family intramembrane serine protease [Gemmatimonadaceae bacterium]|nr:rhomboid family intramembrane serine protease [Gemmatimonadaceae bacterium]